MFLNNRKKALLSVLTASALLGIVLNFVGLAILQSSQAGGGINPFGVLWYFLFFYTITGISVLVVVGTNSLENYRFALLVLIAVSIAYAPSDINFSLSITTIQQTAGGLKVAGLVLYILSLLPMIVMIGAEKESVLNSFILDMKNTKPKVANGASPIVVVQS